MKRKAAYNTVSPTYIHNTMPIKLQKISTINGTVTTTDYVNGFEYSNQTLSSLQTAEGRVVWDAGLNHFRDEYFIKDHLGNNRVIISDLNDDGILQAATEVTATYNYDVWGL